MNSRQMQDSGLNDKVLCCCYFVKQYIMELGKGKEKNLKDIAHDQKDIETLGVPVVDASAKSVENVLDDKGRMTRRVKVEKAPVIKSAKLPALQFRQTFLLPIVGRFYLFHSFLLLLHTSLLINFDQAYLEL